MPLIYDPRDTSDIGSQWYQERVSRFLGPGTRNWTEKGRQEQKQEQFIEKNTLPREERESLVASGAQLQSQGP